MTSHNVIIVLTELSLSCAHVFFVDSRKVCNSFVPSCRQQHAHAHTSTQGHTRLPYPLSACPPSPPFSTSSTLSPIPLSAFSNHSQFHAQPIIVVFIWHFSRQYTNCSQQAMPPQQWSLLPTISSLTPARCRKVSIFVLAPHFCGIEGVNRWTTYSGSAWAPRPLGQYKFTLD